MAKQKLSFEEWSEEFRRQLKASLPAELAKTMPEDFHEGEMKVVYEAGGTVEEALRVVLPLIAILLLAFPTAMLACDCENCKPVEKNKPRRRVRLDVPKDNDGEASFSA